MSIYTIIIRPEDDSEAETTVSVDVDGATTRILELSVRAGGGGGLPSQLPLPDFTLLLRAILAATVDDQLPMPPNGSLVRRAGAREGERQGGIRLVDLEGQRHARLDSVPAPSNVLGARAYRRMPDDLMEVFERTRSVTAVSRHYGVPRHTAQGWINRLR